MISVIVKPSKKLVIVNENCNCTDDVGVIDELNATSLNFEFPKKIEGVPIEEFNKEIIFQNAGGLTTDKLLSNVFKLAKKHTQYPQIRIQLRLTTPEMEWLSFPTLFTFAEHLTPVEPIHPPSGDEEPEYPEDPEEPPEEHECVTIYGFFGVPEVSDLTCRGAPIKIVIPRGEVKKIMPFGEVIFAEGILKIEGILAPELIEGTDLDNVTIIIENPVYESWNLIGNITDPEPEIFPDNPPPYNT